MAPSQGKLYPRGSEWRRWDLHVHTPASALANRFGSWDEYIAHLQAQKQISVIGVTDYCSIEGYKRLLSKRKAGQLKNIETLIPNIEFRTLPVTEVGRAVNFHILVSPDADDHVEQIEAALNALQLELDGSQYSCTTIDLRRLGKKKTGQNDDDLNFREGVNQYRIPFSDLRLWYDRQKWLRENSIVVLSNSSKDGASGLKDSGVLLHREDHYRFSHAIFSANPNDRTYFLGEGTDSIEKLKKAYGSIKSCVHGSDAHCVADMFQPDLDRYCWIKADPTFDGLRQIICEPKLRVHIGKEPPRTVDESKYITALHLQQGQHWFAQTQIELNPGLVAILGEKGSGKTALVDMLALTCHGQSFQNDNSSFIEKARPLLGTATAKVLWADGREMSHKLTNPQKDEPAQVRYLSQDFVEELCSRDHSGAELIKQIEEVIFSHIDEGDQAGAPDFEALRRLKTAPYVTQRRSLAERMSRLNTETVELEQRIEQLPAKQKQLAAKQSELAALQKQIKESPSTIDKTITDALVKDRSARAAVVAAVAENAKLKAKLTNLHSWVSTKNVELASIAKELTRALLDCGIPATKHPELNLQIPPAIDALIGERIAILLDEAKKLKGDTVKPDPKGTAIADIDSRIAKSESALKAGEIGQQRLAELQKQEGKILQEVQAATKEIERISTKDQALLSKQKDERWLLQQQYFEQLAEEKKELESLYAPISSMLNGESSAAASKFEFSVRQSRDVDGWVKQGLAMLDGRKRNSITSPDFFKQVEARLKTAWEAGDVATIRTELERILTELASVGTVDSQLLSHATRAMFYDWLYGLDKLDLAYSLSYEGKELGVLSPGTRGIVLLILYLEIDRFDRRPLIIDQPETNLDSASIYADLVPYIRRAKQERQIFLVTHNPNLVVATDADQVIIASAAKDPGVRHPKIHYLTGSLEHTARPHGIREQVCRLLEGGRDAFAARERRYADTPDA